MKNFYESKTKLYYITRNGNVVSINKNNGDTRVLKPNKDRYGYLKVNVNEKTMKIHRLVAKAFIDNPLNKEQVNHINGIKTDNSLGNLVWVTCSENTTHAYNNGLNVNVKKSIRKVTFEQAQRIRVLYNTGKFNQKDLSDKFNISKSSISFIINNKKYKNA